MSSICWFTFLLILCDAHADLREKAESVSSSASQPVAVDHGVSRRLSVLLATGFWPGHLYPIIALGEELVKRGHSVSLCATVMEGSNLLPDLPQSYGINFISAGPDNLTQKSYTDAMRALRSFNRSSMSVLTSAPTLTSFKVRTQVTEIINNFDVLVTDISVIPVGVCHAKLGFKSLIFSPIIPYLDSTRSEWPAPFAGSSITDDMSFLDRLVSRIVPHSLMIMSAFGDIASIDEYCGELITGHDLYNYPGAHIPLIVNTVLGFDFPKRPSALTHYVGATLMSSTPPLDESLRDWLATKENKSVVYVGMGSTGVMAKDFLQAIVEGVSATRLDAVWRLSAEEQVWLEATNLEIDRKRFYISSSVSRQSLFKHPAVAMTFLHCGLNGVQESLSNGLPVICAPNFFDHFEVGARLYSAKVGVSLYSVTDALLGRNKLTAETVTNTIGTLMSNETYSIEAKKMKKIFKFAGGSKRAADLVEFYTAVGYDHLVPAYIKYEWNWVQYYNLDVYCLLALLGFLIVYVFYKSLKCCCKCLCSKLQSKADKTKTE